MVVPLYQGLLVAGFAWAVTHLGPEDFQFRKLLEAGCVGWEQFFGMSGGRTGSQPRPYHEWVLGGVCGMNDSMW